MSIGRICSRIVHLADRGETVLAAASRMKAHDVGSLVVVDEHRHPIGLVTDRDLVMRVMAEGRAPEATRVEAVMSHQPRSVSATTPIEDVVASMRAFGIRRMPVIGDSGELIGIVSIDDVLDLLASELGNVRHVLAKSARGVAPPTRTSPSGRGQGSARHHAGGLHA